jgi:hypothetical protein
MEIFQEVPHESVAVFFQGKLLQDGHDQRLAKGAIKKVLVDNRRLKSEIHVYVIFEKEIQNFELHNSNIALSGWHEIQVYHHPKKQKVE